ncbi:unnamed protein product, partial [Pylaiella littoralis]
ILRFRFGLCAHFCSRQKGIFRKRPNLVFSNPLWSFLRPFVSKDMSKKRLS